jgi:transmembrane sensor
MNQPQFKGLQDEALERLVHATSGHATVGDLHELEAWRERSVAHAKAYRSAIAIWETLGSAAGESTTAQDRAMIAGQVMARSQVLSRRSVLVGGTMAAAATASVGIAIVRPPLGLWPSLSDLMADYRTDAGEQRTITFAEGISVAMNTRTSMVRHPAGSGERIELLAGEAVFSSALKSSGALTAVAANGQVIAAAAQFNLRYDGDAVRVTCLEGSVRVECRDETAGLRAGEQLAYSTRGISSVAAIDPAAVTVWRQGLLIFWDEPLTRVVDEVNRYWRGRIILLNGDLGRRRVTVRIELSRIGEVISYIRSVLDADVRTLPGGVVFLT